ncbi:hypothetical protein CASFOL_018762 [Castilleja foliolosa]|uniref:Reverse transcriptase n=1 Tax=Castilleja foliolosa TaxID=1961234 RepID=A0ABD3D8L6_9LAMI
MCQFSDHSPLLIEFQPSVQYKSRFIFQRMWLDHPQFHSLVEKVWNCSVTGSPGYVMTEKLRRLRKGLKQWNWDVFGNVSSRIKALTSQIEMLDLQLQGEWNADHAQQLQELKIDLEQNIKWNADIERRQRNAITLQDDNGQIISDSKVIGEKAVQFFRNLFKATPYHLDSDFFEELPKDITTEENAVLLSLPPPEEILEAINHLSPESSPGLDGFTGYFFSDCWDIIANDITRLVHGFFKGDLISQSNATACLTLIPKVPNPSTL